MSSQTSSLALLPIELRILILKELDGPPTLFAAIISCRALYDAYANSRETIQTSIAINSTAASSGYCEFLRFALHKFHGNDEIGIRDVIEFIRRFLDWENPQGGVYSPSSVNAVPIPDGEIRWTSDEIQECVFKWARKLCEAKLYTHPATNKPVDTKPDPPTAKEIARVARAFYCFWLYGITVKHRFFHFTDETSRAVISEHRYRDGGGLHRHASQVR
ncbi:hypothetical protein ABW19_dt0202569 [Dactylella cylindrospora]|nr:hypothetical protein ABW19_dt0202569 [Dactylella cylindrospora]